MISRILIKLLTVFVISSIIISCKNNKVLDYKSIITNEFSIVIINKKNGKVENVYSLNESSNEIISCATYDAYNNKIGIGINRYPATAATARIIIVDGASPYKVNKTINTGYDYINDIAFSSLGDIAFVAEKANLTEANDAIIIKDRFDNTIKLFSGDKISNPSWSVSGDKLYFATYDGNNRFIQYVEKNKPNISNKLVSGIFVTTSNKSDTVCYVDLDGNINFIDGNLNINNKITLPNRINLSYIDNIKYIKNSDDIVIQENIKAKTSKLVAMPVPYNNKYELLAKQPIQFYDVYR